MPEARGEARMPMEGIQVPAKQGRQCPREGSLDAREAAATCKTRDTATGRATKGQIKGSTGNSKAPHSRQKTC